MLECDLFGHTQFLHGFADARRSDVECVLALNELIKAGYGDRFVVSHDVFIKYLLTKYGGHGYAHILENVIPVFHDYGVSDDAFRKLLVKTPNRLLTFSDPL